METPQQKYFGRVYASGSDLKKYSTETINYCLNYIADYNKSREVKPSQNYQ